MSQFKVGDTVRPKNDAMQKSIASQNGALAAVRRFVVTKVESQLIEVRPAGRPYSRKRGRFYDYRFELADRKPIATPTAAPTAVDQLMTDYVNTSNSGHIKVETVMPTKETMNHPFIISLQDGNGTLLPAMTPKRYTSKDQAFKVAEEMSNKHGGKFVVFEAIGHYEKPIVIPAKVEYSR